MYTNEKKEILNSKINLVKKEKRSTSARASLNCLMTLDMPQQKRVRYRQVKRKF